MKKFHKRAAVFLTAATLAGLPAGAFFYSSPGSLTVWADNVEVEPSEESSPEDVDFSDGSEAEILADPVEQAQEEQKKQAEDMEYLKIIRSNGVSAEELQLMIDISKEEQKKILETREKEQTENEEIS